MKISRFNDRPSGERSPLRADLLDLVGSCVNTTGEIVRLEITRRDDGLLCRSSRRKNLDPTWPETIATCARPRLACAR